MKKIILLVLVAVIAMSLLTACGNDKKELESIVEDISSTTDEWLAFMTEYGQDASGIESIEDLNTFYSEKAEETDVYIEKFEDLEDRLDAIEDGISETEYTSYKTALETMIGGIEDMKESMENAIVAE